MLCTRVLSHMTFSYQILTPTPRAMSRMNGMYTSWYSWGVYTIRHSDIWITLDMSSFRPGYLLQNMKYKIINIVKIELLLEVFVFYLLMQYFCYNKLYLLSRNLLLLHSNSSTKIIIYDLDVKVNINAYVLTILFHQHFVVFWEHLTVLIIRHTLKCPHYTICS